MRQRVLEQAVPRYAWPGGPSPSLLLLLLLALPGFALLLLSRCFERLFFVCLHLVGFLS